MSWSQLLNSKEFWGAIAAGVPVLTAVAGGTFKFIKGDGNSKNAKAIKIQELIDKNKNSLDKEDIDFLRGRINYYIMQPVARFNQKRYRSKYIYLMNRSKGELNSLPWKRIIPHVQYNCITKSFFLDYSSSEFRKERNKFKGFAVMYAVISVFMLLSLLFKTGTGVPSIDESYFPNAGSVSNPLDMVRVFSIFVYVPFSIFCWRLVPGDSKAEEISQKLSEIDASDYES